LTEIDLQKLPPKPLVTIEASKSNVALNLGELWAYRELLYFLTWRDVMVRYKQTAFGAMWAIIQPLLLMLLFTFFFNRLGGIKSDGLPYPIFSFAGLLPWTFFANAVINSGNSLVGSTNLITKVYFPRLLIPVASVAAGLVDLSIATVLFFGMMVYYHMPFDLSLLMLPVLGLLTTLLAIGLGLWMSALNVKYRDVRHALPFLMQVWMFASPIIYPVPDRWHWLLMLNPLTGIILGFRSAISGRAFDWQALGISALITVVVLVYSTFAFKRMEKSFADVI
jgi:lipopolysaccharide transport system permease protein